MRDNEISIQGVDGIRIPATGHWVGTSARNRPLVIMLHGLTTSKDEYQNAYANLAVTLGSRGVPSLRFDFRGHGGSSEPLSSFCAYTQILDTLSVLDWAAKNIQFSRLTVLGTSYGSVPAILAAGITAPLVQKLVLLAPVLDFRRTFLMPSTSWGREVFGSNAVLASMKTGSLKVQEGFELGRAALLDFLLVDIVPTLSSLSCEVVVLHGRKDDMVPFAVTQDLAVRLGNMRLFPLENTGHGLAEVGDEKREAQRTMENTALLVSQLCGDER